MLLQELQNKVEENQELKKFKDQILFEITQDGLRIQIMDAENRPMFRLGSAQLEPYFEDILLAMSEVIKAVPNNVSVSGHTDAKPFAERGRVHQLGAVGQSGQCGAPCAGVWRLCRTRRSPAWWVMPHRRCLIARIRSIRSIDASTSSC